MISKTFLFICSIPLLVLSLSCRESKISGESVYGEIPQDQYLSGKFYPSKSPLFINPGEVGVPVDGKSHYLRREAAAALKKMYDAFRLENPKVKIIIVSSTRNFWDQKMIWEKKWDSKDYTGAAKSPSQKASMILRYSSMPGTSRHHWGTDFDINTLTNEYYDGGDGKVIFQWLRENAGKFGFCQPYTPGREKGYMEERWHWSYAPLSRVFVRDWNRIFGGDENIFGKKGLFLGAEYSGHLARIYVNSINERCR